MKKGRASLCTFLIPAARRKRLQVCKIDWSISRAWSRMRLQPMHHHLLPQGVSRGRNIHEVSPASNANARSDQLGPRSQETCRRVLLGADESAHVGATRRAAILDDVSFPSHWEILSNSPILKGWRCILTIQLPPWMLISTHTQRSFSTPSRKIQSSNSGQLYLNAWLLMVLYLDTSIPTVLQYVRRKHECV